MNVLDSLAALLDDAATGDDAALISELELQLARALIRSGDLDAAAQHLDRAMTAASALAVAAEWQQVARAYSAAADPAHAEDALRRAAELTPTALPALAQHVQRQRRLPEAIALWERAVQALPGDANGRLTLARLYARTGQPERALEMYLAAVDAAPTMKTRLTVAAALQELQAELPAPGPQRSVRIALLGNATLDHLNNYLVVECFRAGLRPTIYQAGFDQYSQEILDPTSGLYAFEPDVVICAVHASRLFHGLHGDPLSLGTEARRSELEGGLATLQRLLDVLTERTSAMVLVHNMVAPQHPALGVLDAREVLGQADAFAEINARLRQLARDRYRSVFVVDEERIQSLSGKRSGTDARLWYSARMPWSDAVLQDLVREYLRYIRAKLGLARKCIVLDLDNTLWGGVIGEDGLGGIQLGSDAPGNAFVAFQAELRKLARRGILLAIASKNNAADAAAALENHPDMLLRPSDFAAQRINWNEKTISIREIAAELNIGIDSLVFLDDNPVERAKVRAELPQVLVPELPTDPAEYRAALLELGVFDTLALTAEDLQRSQLYADQRARRESALQLAAAGSLEDYLADLDLRVDIEPANAMNLARIAQLTGKTNQFNLTTRRYSEADITTRLAAGWRVYGARVKDRFGDNGLTGVLMVDTTRDDTWTIDNFLLSCRVLGRKVESALLATLLMDARSAGVAKLEGWFIPTEKNAPARDVYAAHGFAAVSSDAESTLWQFDAVRQDIALPDWLTVTRSDAAVAALA